MHKIFVSSISDVKVETSNEFGFKTSGGVLRDISSQKNRTVGFVFLFFFSFSFFVLLQEG